MSEPIFPQSVEEAIAELEKLPGVGPKTASRLAFYLLSRPAEEVKKFGETLGRLKEGLTDCQECFNITVKSPCPICRNPGRDRRRLMVVEEPLDVLALEKAGWQGRYFVLGGVISPMEGIGPQDLRIAPLLDRLNGSSDNLVEIVIATNPSLEGEATALYLAQKIKQLAKDHPKVGKIKLTRIARGLPVGSDLEYADEVTLQRALEGRRAY